ncbi:ketoacyl-ACP synthase III [Massilia sp. PWRC2]|uniref:ketoacyl-ACP synthase III n=1 Tax=Massilia sp. PWRC2 TaxID=2804626 RepID=UPI003CF1CDE3
MAQVKLQNVRYAGMTTCVPHRVLSNIRDCPPQMRNARERLVRNIGIEERRICASWQTFSDLAFDAAEQLITTLNWQRDEIDALIIVSQSPDYLLPSTAIIMQDRLKLSQSTIAFDINLGCSGYAFGLHVLGAMIASGGIKKGLILIGDRSAGVIDPLFSDAASVTALEYDPAAPPMYFDLNSDGSGHRTIMLPAGGHREPFGIQHALPWKDSDGMWRSPTELCLDGPAVLSFSTQVVPPAVRKLLEFADCPIADVDYFLFHQANRMINETIRKKLGLEADKVPSSLRDFGNTSGASIPLTMTTRIGEQLDGQSARLLMCGFGVGLSWGTCLVDVAGAVFPALIES